MCTEVLQGVARVKAELEREKEKHLLELRRTTDNTLLLSPAHEPKTQSFIENDDLGNLFFNGNHLKMFTTHTRSKKEETHERGERMCVCVVRVRVKKIDAPLFSLFSHR
jgi:hypothetical protein